MNNKHGRACADDGSTVGAKAPLSLRSAFVAAETLALGAALAAGSAGVAQAAAATTAAASNDVQAVEVLSARPDRNLYADPVAPYKVDLLSTSKFTQPLINIPKTITVIPKEVIRDSGATTFRDLMRTQPGVTLGTGEGGNAFGDRFFVRGFDTRNDIYVDGVRDPGVGSREIFDVEQVEVLKGPSSTFGGRGTTGAAISLVSKMPTQTNFLSVMGTMGTDATHRVTADLNHTFGEKLSVRINAMAHESHVAGRDYVFNDRWGYAAAVAYKPVESLTVTADFYHLDTNELPDWGFTYDLANNRPFQVPRRNFYGVLQRDFRENWADIGTVKVNWQLLENLKLQSIVRYGQTANAYIASAPEAPAVTNPNQSLWTVRANPKSRDAITTTRVNQTTLTWDVDGLGLHHSVVVGYELSREEVRNRQYANLSAELGGGVIVAPTTIVQNLFRPDPTQPWPFPKALSAVRKTTVETTGLFALDTIELSDKWQVTGGVRWDQYDIRLSNGVITPAASTTKLQNKVDFTNFTVGLVYKPTPNGTLYAAVGTSSNPSGEQLDAAANDYGGLAANNQALDAEQNTAYELGVKWNVAGGHLTLNAAAFRIEKDNGRSQSGSGASLVVSSNGQQRVNGFEIGATGNVTSKLSVFGGYTHLNGKVTASRTPSEIGAPFPNIAKDSFTMMARYAFTDKFYLGGQANYNSKKNGGTIVATNTFVPGYWRMDLFGGYRINNRAEISFNLLNATNKLYYDALYRSATPFVYLAPGVSGLVKLRYDF